MNLVEIRETVVKISGRYDLVVDTTDWADSGMDFYVNAGQNMLDRMGIIKENEIALAMTLAIGEYSATFSQRCMSILEVWVSSATDRSKLEKTKKLSDLKEYYPELVSEITTGTPLYYSPASVRALEAASRDDLGTFLNLALPDVDLDYRGIIIGPPTDEARIIEVFGKFYQDELTTDDQENYWTSLAPEILVKAALYQIYTFSGRLKEAETMKAAMGVETVHLDMIGVEEDIAEVDEMGE